MVPYAQPLTRSGQACESATNTVSIMRKIVSVYPPTGFGAVTDSSVPSGITKLMGSSTPALAGTSRKTCFSAT